MPQSLFNLITILPLAFWISMILFPKTLFTQRMVMNYWVYIGLGIFYATTVIAFIATNLDILTISFDSFRAALTSDWGLLMVWTQLSIFNLFIAVWIFRDAKYWGIKPLWYLVSAYFLPPLALAIYLLIRQQKAKKDPIRHLN